jgi:hypothetical protein
MYWAVMPSVVCPSTYPAVVIHSGSCRGAQVPKLELRLRNPGRIPCGVEPVAEHILGQRLARLVHSSKAVSAFSWTL